VSSSFIRRRMALRGRELGAIAGPVIGSWVALEVGAAGDARGRKRMLGRTDGDEVSRLVLVL
jgi:hypothetical protein